MNRNIRNIFIVVLVSFFISLCFEIYSNKLLIKKNKIFNPEIIEVYDIEKKSNSLITKSTKSYIKIKLDNTKYINKISFNYRSNKNFSWKCIYYVDDQLQKKDYSSSKLINKAVRIIDSSTNVIKIAIKSKNVKLSNIQVDNRVNFNFLRFFIISFSIILLYILYCYRTYFYKNLEKAFLILAIIYGVFMILATPKVIGQSFDDNTHLKNSFSFVSSESFTTKKSYLINESIGLKNTQYFKTNEEYNLYYKFLNSPENSKNIKVLLEDYSPKYTKFIYLPYYIGLKFSSVLNFNYINSLLIARLFNYLVYVLLIFFAIKYSTYAKKIIFLLGLVPARIYYGVQFSYDSLIIASFILSFALFLRMLEKEKIDKKSMIIFILLTVWASLPKAVYAPYLLLLLFIPKEKFDNKKQCNLFKTSIIFIELLLVSTFLLPIIMNTATADIRGGNVSVSGQLNFITNNFIDFSIMMLKYLYQEIPCMFLGSFQFFGLGYLYKAVNNISGTFYLVFLICILYFIFTENVEEKRLPKKYKILFTLFILIFMIGIPFTMYLVYVDVGTFKIDGVQQRYFYQLLFPLFMIFIPSGKKTIDNNKYALFLVPILTLLFSIVAMIINIPLL